jgi:hypothetical protein
MHEGLQARAHEFCFWATQYYKRRRFGAPALSKIDTERTQLHIFPMQPSVTKIMTRPNVVQLLKIHKLQADNIKCDRTAIVDAQVHGVEARNTIVIYAVCITIVRSLHTIVMQSACSL